jgi:hypothetical protein
MWLLDRRSLDKMVTCLRNGMILTSDVSELLSLNSLAQSLEVTEVNLIRLVLAGKIKALYPQNKYGRKHNERYATDVFEDIHISRMLFSKSATGTLGRLLGVIKK